MALKEGLSAVKFLMLGNNAVINSVRDALGSSPDAFEQVKITQFIQQLHRTSQSRCKAIDLYSVDAPFESGLGHRLC
jgi:hypothetical protein